MAITDNYDFGPEDWGDYDMGSAIERLRNTCDTRRNIGRVGALKSLLDVTDDEWESMLDDLAREGYEFSLDSAGQLMVVRRPVVPAAYEIVQGKVVFEDKDGIIEGLRQAVRERDETIADLRKALKSEELRVRDARNDARFYAGVIGQIKRIID